MAPLPGRPPLCSIRHAGADGFDVARVRHDIAGARLHPDPRHRRDNPVLDYETAAVAGQQKSRIAGC